MSNNDIVRAWKDTYNRNSLKKGDDDDAPENPAGEEELSDEELSEAGGGIRNQSAAQCDTEETLQGPCCTPWDITST